MTRRRTLDSLGLCLAVLLLAALPLPSAAESAVHRTVLPNGLTVLVKEAGERDIVGLELLFRAGLLEAEEECAPPGGQNLIMQVLLGRLEGTGGESLERMGCEASVAVNPDYTSVSVTCPARCALPMLRRLAAALRDRNVYPQELVAAKRSVLTELDSDEESLKAVYDVFLATYYGYHPYRTPVDGAPRAVEAMTAEKLDPFFQRCFVPNRMVLAVVGRVRASDVAAAASDLFGGLEPCSEASEVVPFEPKSEQTAMALASGGSLGWVFMGFPAPSFGTGESAAMRVAFSLLCDGLSSRFWIEVREKRGLAYELGGTYPVLLGPAHMTAYFITTPEQVDTVCRLAFGEVARLQTDPVGSAELEGTKRKVLGRYLLERETRNGLASALAIAEVLGAGFEYDEAFPGQIERVTADDILAVARNYLGTHTVITASSAVAPGGE